MKIIHTVASIEEESAGPSHSVPGLAKETASLVEDVSIFSIGPVGQDVKRGFRHKRFNQDYQSIPIVKALSVSSSMYRGLLDEPADIIHNHGLWLMPNIYSAWIARKIGIPLIWTPRGMLSPEALKFSSAKKSVFSKVFQSRALQDVTLFHATSEQEYRDIRAYGLKQPVAIISNGIDIPDLKPVKKRARRTLLFLARLHPLKGLENLLKAWSKVEQNFPDWDLKIIGPGTPRYIASLEKLISQLGLTRATLCEEVNGAAKLEAYQAAELFILPSKSENFAMTVAESLSCQVPVICTNRAPWSGLTQNKCGWWVEPSVESLESTLHIALEKPSDELNRMGKNGQEWMRREFSWAGIATAMNDLVYEPLVLGKTLSPAIRID